MKEALETRIREVKQFPLQTVSLIIFLFSATFFLYIIASLDIGIYAYILKKILQLISTPIGWLLGAFGLELFFWDLWKRIPTKLHLLISLAYGALIVIAFPTLVQKIKEEYQKLFRKKYENIQFN